MPPRKSLDSAIEHRITFGNYERALVTEIKTDVEKSLKIATVGAVAVPVTIGVGLVGGMGLLGYGLYQGLSSFGFGNITKEIGEELSDIKSNVWCWWTNKNRKFWGLEPIDCSKNDPDKPPSRRERERTDQEQLEYEAHVEERKRRTEQRKQAQREEMGDEAYEQMLADFNPADHSNAGVSQTEEERAMREARRAEAAERRAQEDAEAKAEHDRQTAERRAEYERRQREEEQRAQEGDTDPSTPNPDEGSVGYQDPDEEGESQRGGGSSRGGGEGEGGGSGERDESGNAPSRRDDRDDGRGSRG